MSSSPSYISLCLNIGLGDACEDDIDNDGILNVNDNCIEIPNSNQADSDGDGIGDVCDNCPNVNNPGQEDENGNFIGDPCDIGEDTDNDGVVDGADNCPSISNSDQLDTDHDGKCITYIVLGHILSAFTYVLGELFEQFQGCSFQHNWSMRNIKYGIKSS